MSSARIPRLANPYSLGVGTDQVSGDVPGPEPRSAALSAGVGRTLAVGLLGAGASVGLGVLGQGAAFAEDDDTTSVESSAGGSSWDGSSDRTSQVEDSDRTAVEVSTVQLPDVSAFESSPVPEVGSDVLGDSRATTGGATVGSSDLAPSSTGTSDPAAVRSEPIALASVPAAAPEGPSASEVPAEPDVLQLGSPSTVELRSVAPAGGDLLDTFPDIDAVEPSPLPAPARVPAPSDPLSLPAPAPGPDVGSSPVVVAPVPDRSAPPVLDVPEVQDGSTGTDDPPTVSDRAVTPASTSGGDDRVLSAPPELVDGTAPWTDAERRWGGAEEPSPALVAPDTREQVTGEEATPVGDPASEPLLARRTTSPGPVVRPRAPAREESVPRRMSPRPAKPTYIPPNEPPPRRQTSDSGGPGGGVLVASSDGATRRLPPGWKPGGKFKPPTTPSAPRCTTAFGLTFCRLGNPPSTWPPRVTSPRPAKPTYTPPNEPPPRRQTSDSGGVLVASSAPSDSGGLLPAPAVTTEVDPASGTSPGSRVVAQAVRTGGPGKANWGDFFDDAPQIGKGSTGPLVVDLQLRLERLGYMTWREINEKYGSYDENTAAAVRRLQTTNHLQPNGSVGPTTADAIQRMLDRLKRPELGR